MPDPRADRARGLEDPELVTTLMNLIRDQLGPDADEMVHYAADDTATFCALALGEIQRGRLTVPEQVRVALQRGLAWTSDVTE
ncbi:hypothetical protein ABIE44_001500 [Marmoricola sp. OAE513]|uniref:hypothetical protein n=1 Tax=Marmoricola sp. OAE513 TaxID=2817894 RepID=UPI001AE65284